MDRTKKYVLAAILCSLLLIVSITIYNGVSGNFTNDPITDLHNVNDAGEEQKIAVSQRDDESENANSEVSETNPVANCSEETLQSQEDNSTSQIAVSQTKDNSSNQTSSSLSQSENSSKEASKEDATSDEKEASEEKEKKLLTYSITILGLDDFIGSGEVFVEEQTQVTAFDVLKLYANENGITLNVSGSGSMVYVRGINGLNEFDHGRTSGWMYRVNGTAPNVGAGRYVLKENDLLEWYYVSD